MASPSSGAIFFLLLLSTSLVSPSRADLIAVRGVHVTGLLVCSSTGNPSPLCPTCGGIQGVNVTITCNDATTNIGSVFTDASGFFNAFLNLADGLLFDSSSLPCFVIIKLPIASCTLLAPTGTLQAPPVTFVGNAITGAIGLVAEGLTGLFVFVPL